jgi:hypothetical protein
MTIEPVTQPDRLRQAIHEATLNGWRLESISVSDRSATMLAGSQVNHVVHALVSLGTCGLWLVGWLIAVATNKPLARLFITVDEYGRVSSTSAWV